MQFGQQRCEFHKCDVSAENELHSEFERVIADHTKIDIFISNAGIVNEIGATQDGGCQFHGCNLLKYKLELYFMLQLSLIF